MKRILEFRIYFRKSTNGFHVFCRVDRESFSWPYTGLLSPKEFRTRQYALKYVSKYIKHCNALEIKKYGNRYLWVVDKNSLFRHPAHEASVRRIVSKFQVTPKQQLQEMGL